MRSGVTRIVVFYFQGKVIVVDFNPFGTVTDSLLFSWEELFDTNADTNSALVCQVQI